MGAKITPILRTLRHRTPRALCRSIETNTDSLVKGMILFDQGGGGGEGGKVMVESAAPRQSVVRLFFDVVCAKYIHSIVSDIFAGSKYWRETHLQDPHRLAQVARCQVRWRCC